MTHGKNKGQAQVKSQRIQILQYKYVMRFVFWESAGRIGFRLVHRKCRANPQVSPNPWLTETMLETTLIVKQLSQGAKEKRDMEQGSASAGAGTRVHSWWWIVVRLASLGSASTTTTWTWAQVNPGRIQELAAPLEVGGWPWSAASKGA